MLHRMTYFDQLLTFLLLRDGSIDPIELAAAASNLDPTDDEATHYPTILAESELISAERLDAAVDELRRLLELHDWNESEVSKLVLGAVDAHRLWRFSMHQARLAKSRDEQADPFLDRGLHASGGLGVVWKVRERFTGREVALKQMRPELVTNKDLRRRFIAEGRITARLEHANIVPIYYVSEPSPDESPYYVMRFLKGETLEDAVKTARESLARNVAAWKLATHSLTARFVRACEAVAYAHSKGVLHRDIKPSNIILGDFGDVFLVDWGLAKVDGEADADGIGVSIAELSETQAGQAIGTPLWMAPEQALGAIDQVDRRTDIYGLGATLFTILTGEAPHLRFEREGAEEMLARIASTPARRARAVNRFVSPAEDAICSKAMAHDTADRYQSVEELSSDLRNLLDREPITAYREPWPRRFARRMIAAPIQSITIVSILTTVVICLATGAMALYVERNVFTDLFIVALQDQADDAARSLSANVHRLTEELTFLSTLPEISELLTTPSNAVTIDHANATIEHFLVYQREYAAVALVTFDEDSNPVVRFARQRDEIEAAALSDVAEQAPWVAFIERASSLPDGAVTIAQPFQRFADSGHPARRFLHAAVAVHDRQDRAGVLWVMVDPTKCFADAFGVTFFCERVVVLDSRSDVLFWAFPADATQKVRDVYRIYYQGGSKQLYRPLAFETTSRDKVIEEHAEITAFIEDPLSDANDLLIRGKIAAFVRKLPSPEELQDRITLVILVDKETLLSREEVSWRLLGAAAILLFVVALFSLLIGAAVIRVASR